MLRRATRSAALIAALIACRAFLVPDSGEARADGARADGALVAQVAVHQGNLPDLLVAYGSVGPAQNGGMLLSLQQDGRVSAILVTPGEQVAIGAPLVEVELNPGSAGAYSQAVSAMSLARSQRAHLGRLLSQHLATRDQLAQADKAVSDAQTTVQTLRRQGADQARTTVTAPFNGIVSAITALPGDRIASGTALLTLVRLDGLVLTVGIEAQMQPRLHPGQAATLQRVGPDPGQEAIPSRVLRVDSMINPKTRLVDVDLALPGRGIGPGFVSGEPYRAAITLGALAGWIVPHDAVLEDTTGCFLFQLLGQTARRVAVQVLGTVGDQDAVAGRIDAQHAVITQGATQLADGDPVRSTP